MTTTLVTGADGFIGSHLVEKLVISGQRVRAFVFYNSFNSWGWLDTLPAEVKDAIEVVSGDIRDCGMVEKAMRGVDRVFHLAALIGIPYSYHAPESYVDTNIRGTLNILKSARSAGTSRVIVTSTSEVYGTAEYVPIDEAHPLKAQSPYSATKIAADKLAESFWRSFGLPVSVARPFNTYGPRQSARAIIPTIITQLLSGAQEVHLGSLAPTRDLTYVEDTCAGFLAIAEAEDTVGEVLNIGTGKTISMGDLANTIADLISADARVVEDEKRVRPGASEVERLMACTDRLHELTGWQACLSLREGLAKTISWFQENADRYKADVYNT